MHFFILTVYGYSLPPVRTEVLTVPLMVTGSTAGGYGLVLRPALTDPSTAVPELAAVMAGSPADG